MGAVRAGHGKVGGWRDERLNLPESGSMEDITDGEACPGEELLGAEWAKAELGGQAVGIDNLTSYGTKSSVKASSSPPLMDIWALPRLPSRSSRSALSIHHIWLGNSY